jgi:Recombination endonuclease VII
MIEEKECNKCKKFSPKSNFSKDSTRIEGVRDECKPCLNAARKIMRDTRSPEEKAKWAAYRKQYYSDKRKGIERPKRTKKYCPKEARLKRIYGLNTEEYNKLVELQKGLCKICNKLPDCYRKKLYVEHCHTTGKVRGLVCLKCNSVLGFAKDNLNVLKAAILYLEASQEKGNEES